MSASPISGRFRKHLKRYLAGLPSLQTLLAQMVSAPEPEALLALLDEAGRIAESAGARRS